MPINRILTSQQDIQIAIRQLDDELTTLKSQLATAQDTINRIKTGALTIYTGGGGSNGGGVAPGVIFSGDLTGNSSAQTVVGLQNKPVAAVVPTTNQLLNYNGTLWTPTSTIQVDTITVNGSTILNGGLAVTGLNCFTDGLGHYGCFYIDSTTTPGQINAAMTFQGSGMTYLLDIKGNLTVDGPTIISNTLNATNNITSSTAVVAPKLYATNPAITNWTRLYIDEVTNPGFSYPVIDGSPTGLNPLTLQMRMGLTITKNSIVCQDDVSAQYLMIQAKDSTVGNQPSIKSSTGIVNILNTIKPASGLIIPNNQPIQFLEPTNTFTSHQFICGGGGSFNLQDKSTAGGTFTSSMSVDTSGNVSFTGAGTHTINGPTQINNTLGVTGAATFSFTINATNNITSSASVVGCTGLYAANTAITNWARLWLGNSNTQPTLDFGGGAAQSLIVSGGILGTNISASIRLQITGGTSDITLFGAGGSQFMQLFPPGNAAIGANPGLYSSTGTIRFLSTNIQCDAGTVTTLGLNVTNTTNITLGSGWVDYVPTVASGGGGTATYTSKQYAWYLRIGPIIFFQVEIAVNIAGSPVAIINVGLPVVSTLSGSQFSVVNAITSVSGWSNSITSLIGGIVQVYAGNNITGTYPVGACEIRISGFYRCA